jgi:hypothetical protein
MDAISESQSRHDKSCQSPAKFTVPSTHAHSPDPEDPNKWSNVGDIKDPDNPSHRWVAFNTLRKGHKEDLKKDPRDEQYQEHYHKQRQDSPPTWASPVALSLLGLEDIPEEESAPSDPRTEFTLHYPINGPSTMPGALSPTSPSDP